MPIETDLLGRVAGAVLAVAFTPKGGCPLKLDGSHKVGKLLQVCSIHPQGWVPIETQYRRIQRSPCLVVAFTPKGGCPLKRANASDIDGASPRVAFTPKGGCPLKLENPARCEL